MSNRRGRGRPTSAYATRMRRRSLPGRPGAAVALRRWFSVPSMSWLPLALAVAAEAVHLVAGYLEWPGSAVRGGGHVIVAGVLGLVAAAALSGAGRPRLAVAGVVALVGPLWWLVGALAGAAPYQELPVAAAVGVTLAELALAATLLGTGLAARVTDPAATRAGATGRTRAAGRPA